MAAVFTEICILVCAFMGGWIACLLWENRHLLRKQ